MKAKLSYVMLGLLCVAAINSCKKSSNNSANSGGSAKREHGFGALLDSAAYAKVPTVNLDELKAKLISAGLLSKQKVNGPPPTSMILNYPSPSDQGSDGTCVSFSTGYSTMGTINNEFPTVNVSNPRSPYYVYQKDHSAQGDCSTQDGMYLLSGVKILQSNGVPAYASDNNLGSPCTAPSSAVNSDAASNKSFSYGKISSVAEIKQAIAMHLPIAIGFSVYQSFVDSWYNGTTFSTLSGALNEGHSMSIIGYDDTKNAVLVENSWGTYGGDASHPGCMWFDYGLITNSSLNLEMYVVSPVINSTLDVFFTNSSTLQYNMQQVSPSTNTGTKITVSDSQPVLIVGQSIYSPSHSCRLTLQTDGNLVLYKENSNGTETGIWSSRTVGQASTGLYFQTDGNLVLYGGNHSPSNPAPGVWASMLYNNTGPNTVHYAFYLLQDDGNFVEYWPTYDKTYGGVWAVVAATDTGDPSGGKVTTHGGNLNPWITTALWDYSSNFKSTSW